MQNNNIIQVISITLVLLILSAYVGPIVAPNQAVVTAQDVDEEKIYKGLIVTALLMYTIDKLTDDAKASNSKEVSSSGGYSDKVIWLARAIHAEARGEPYQGKVAVGAVILNRVASNQFPDTIYGVIHQKNQFTSVENGQINLTPHQSSYSAAKRALQGKDPSRGALYFYNPEKARTLWWLETRETTVKIGDHVFAK